MAALAGVLYLVGCVSEPVVFYLGLALWGFCFVVGMVVSDLLE